MTLNVETIFSYCAYFVEFDWSYNFAVERALLALIDLTKSPVYTRKLGRLPNITTYAMFQLYFVVFHCLHCPVAFDVEHRLRNNNVQKSWKLRHLSVLF